MVSQLYGSDVPGVGSRTQVVTTGGNGGGSISTIPGLAPLLSHGGLQLISTRPNNPMSTSGALPATVKAGSVLGATTRTHHRMAFASPYLVLVYTGYTGADAAANNPLKIRATIQLKGSTLADETGARVPVTFNGARYGEPDMDGFVISDPIPFSVSAQQDIFIYTYAQANGAACQIPLIKTAMGGSAAGSSNNGEGSAADDIVISGASTQGLGVCGYGPVAILGYSSTPKPSVACFGDSIATGWKDFGSVSNAGGYLWRWMRNETAIANTSAHYFENTPNFPFTLCAVQGDTLQRFAQIANSYKTLRVAEFATTWICEYGSNDIASRTLAQMKADYLTIAGWAAARNKKYLQCTLVPRVTSTDGFLTVANQTVGSGEAVRTGVNSWLRDGSASGFVAQAAALGCTANYIDAAATIEVNSSGVLTLNGGFWPAALTPVKTGTLTAVGTTVETDSTLGVAQDFYRGYRLRMTSGAFSGGFSDISQQTSAGAMTIVGVGGTPTIGDGYAIEFAATAEGTHPTTWGHWTIANGLNVPANNSLIV